MRRRRTTNGSSKQPQRRGQRHIQSHSRVCNRYQDQQQSLDQDKRKSNYIQKQPPAKQPPQQQQFCQSATNSSQRATSIMGACIVDMESAPCNLAMNFLDNSDYHVVNQANITTTSSCIGTLPHGCVNEQDFDDDDYDNDDDDNCSVEYEQEDEKEELGTGHSMCRHCLRPQAELQLRYIYSSRSRSKSHQRNTKHYQHQHQHKQRKRSKQRYLHQVLPMHTHPHQDLQSLAVTEPHSQRMRWQQINTVSEEAIRFRCPQVGPLVGRDLHTPQPMHFHHPQQLQHPQGQPGVPLIMPQPAPLNKTKSRTKTKAKQRQQQPKQKHKLTANTGTCSTAAVIPALSTSAKIGPPQTTIMGMLPNNGTDQLNNTSPRTDVPPTTLDSPSLVTVSTWYTVAKQGVSC